MSKLSDDGDPWESNNLLTPEQLDPGGPSNRFNRIYNYVSVS